jgi:hypothetical protein
MDQVIRLDLPNPFYRLLALLHYTSRYLSPHLSPDQEQALQRIHHIATDSAQPEESGKGKEKIHPVQSSEEIVASLEEIFERKIDLNSESDELPPATPLPAKKQTLAGTAAVAGSNNGKKKAKRNSAPKPGDPPVDITPPSEAVSEAQSAAVEEVSLHGAAMDLVWCLAATLLQSDGWSYREIEKFLKGILSAVLSTERSAPVPLASP